MRIYTYTETCGPKAGRVCNEEELDRYRKLCEQPGCMSDSEPGFGQVNPNYEPDPNCARCGGTGTEIDSADLRLWEGTPEEIAKQAREQIANHTTVLNSTACFLCRQARAVLAELGEE